MGVPTIDYAMKTLSIAATADEQALKDMAKGGKHKVILQEEKAPQLGTRGRADRNELKKMKDQFAEDWNAGDFVLLDNVADTKIISQTAAELRLLENRGFEVNDIARILGIPRIMMMEDQGASYKMPEHATQEFLLRTIQPRIRSYEDEFNSKMLNEYDFGSRRIHVCELALRRLDAKGQAEIDKLHLETGWSVNELRSQYDLPSIAEGDAHYVSTNLAETGSEKLRSNGGGRPSENPTVNPDEENDEQ
jgi:HK97 family phage portal protein